MRNGVFAAVLVLWGAGVCAAQGANNETKELKKDAQRPSTESQLRADAKASVKPADRVEKASEKLDSQEPAAASNKAQGSPLMQAPAGVFNTAIADNSFFIEEAFNQEPGAVQHISNFVYLRNESFAYVLTQEWPVPNQRHQFSFTLPYMSLAGSPREHGVGDILLNYRFGAVQHANTAFAPRVSLVIPSGSNNRGLGNGSAGVQFNLPVSHRFHENWIYHLNAGATILPRARAITLGGPVRRNINSVNLGGSLIWLARPNFNALLETFAELGQSIDATGAVNRDKEVFMSPGVRWAINVGDLQIVPGFAVPFRLNNNAEARGVFFYLSFEHPFGRRVKP